MKGNLLLVALLSVVATQVCAMETEVLAEAGALIRPVTKVAAAAQEAAQQATTNTALSMTEQASNYANRLVAFGRETANTVAAKAGSVYESAASSVNSAYKSTASSVGAVLTSARNQYDNAVTAAGNKASSVSSTVGAAYKSAVTSADSAYKASTASVGSAYNTVRNADYKALAHTGAQKVQNGANVAVTAVKENPVVAAAVLAGSVAAISAVNTWRTTPGAYLAKIKAVAKNPFVAAPAVVSAILVGLNQTGYDVAALNAVTKLVSK